MLIKPESVRPIPAQRNPDQVNEDLSALCQRAMDHGAAAAEIVTPENLVFSPEIDRQMAEPNDYPSIHWPLEYPRDNLAEALRSYQSGILCYHRPPSHVPDYAGGAIADDDHRAAYQRIYEIVTAVESAAFYMGYHMALGLAAGNCRSIFCHTEKNCRAAYKGMTCIHPYKGRPAMAAAGLDAAEMARNLDWPVDAAHLSGLVMIL